MKEIGLFLFMLNILFTNAQTGALSLSKLVVQASIKSCLAFSRHTIVLSICFLLVISCRQVLHEKNTSLEPPIDIDNGYMVTLGIRWAELQQKPRNGLTMGVNFVNGDNDGDARQLYDWVGAWPMRSPYAYGDLVIEK